jgi:Sigma-70, region 4
MANRPNRMKLQTPKVLASAARSGTGERLRNSITASCPSLSSLETFRNTATTLPGHSIIRSHCYCRKRRVTGNAAAFLARCFPRRIKIPDRLRDWPLQASSLTRRISTRLAHTLRSSDARVLGDLHGRRVGDFAWQRNCGLKTLQELDSLASILIERRPCSHGAVRRLKRGTSSDVDASQRRGYNTQHGSACFAIPKSVRRLRFDELPITKRLANVLRSNGLQTFGNLNGRAPFELLQYKACGWRTLVEIRQLIERAIAGEFDVARIDESRAVAELVTLLERGLTKLAPRDRQFLLARIRGMTFAEIGRRHGFTRARVHQAVVNGLGALKKSWGPRIPRLLAMTKTRCCSIANSQNLRERRGSGLTPALLEQWVGNASKDFRLSREAQLRLIAALNKNISVSLD